MSLNFLKCEFNANAIKVLVGIPVAGDPGIAPANVATNYVVYANGISVVPLDTANLDENTGVLTLVPAERLRGDSISILFRKPILGTQDVMKLDLPRDQNLVRQAARATSAVEDAVSYPLLTEDVGAGMRSSGTRGRGGAGTNLSDLVNRTLTDVLGWKTRTDDPTAFQGALTASFEGDEADGVTTWKWVPRSYAVQTDLSGGISGAQASLYKRAQEALTQSLPLLDGLYPLDPTADRENVDALKAVVRTQLSQLVNELATPGGPSEARIDQYFLMLLASSISIGKNGKVLQTEPNDLGGTLGKLRDLLGLSSKSNFINTIEDEQDQTNFRILADYVTSLALSWFNNRRFFGLRPHHPFLGTQLVPLSRQLSVISEAVDEVRFTLDSVFIGSAERQTLRLEFSPRFDSMYAEDFFQWIQNFVRDEAPVYIQQGGKFGIGNSLLPLARRLRSMVGQLVRSVHSGVGRVPSGLRTQRVVRSLESLHFELRELVHLATPLAVDFTSTSVPSQAIGASGGLRVAPPEVEFLEVEDVESVVVTNAGTTAFNLTAVLAGKDAGSFNLWGNPTFPIEVLPSASVTIEVELSAAASGLQAEVQFTASIDPGNPAIVKLVSPT